jgi:hypothetical protein
MSKDTTGGSQRRQSQRSTGVVLVASELRLGWRTVGALAAATLGSGPTLLLFFALLFSVIYGESYLLEIAGRPAALAFTFVESLIYVPIVSLPATIVHMAAVGLLARHGRDALGWSLASGAALGIMLAGLLILIVLLIGGIEGFDSLERPLLYLVSVPFGATGTLMGLLYWSIAIRPRRQWRLRREQSEDAILAME